MSYRYTYVKHYKRGAKWPDGEARMCIACGSLGDLDKKGRRRQAVVTAVMKYAGATTRMPVAYCDEHLPDDLRKR